jgi:hypothetical protein
MEQFKQIIMTSEFEDLIEEAYSAFNARDIDSALQHMHEDVQWPNGWEGGYIIGRHGVRNYWTRQWKEINPKVIPVSFNEKQNGEIEVTVHQTVKDQHDSLLFDGMVKHIYTFANGKIKSLEIVK